MASTTPTEKNSKCELPKLLTIFPVIAPPFSPQQFFFKPNSTVLALSPADVLHNFHKSIASNADKFLQFLHFSATQNPFLNKILSLSSYLQNFSQVHCRNYRSLNCLSSHNFAAVYLAILLQQLWLQMANLGFAPILAFLALNAITSAAAALPAELPPVSVSHEGSTLPKQLPGLSDLTTSQRKWQRRLQSKKSTTSDDSN
ncbi:YlmG-like protein 2 chloroplastic [Bienertia sinuspersici]